MFGAESINVENYLVNKSLEDYTKTVFPINFREIQRHIDDYVCVISIMANVTLIVLAFTEKNQGIKAYSNVLLLNCIFDLFNTITSFIVGIQMEFGDGYYIMVVTNPLFKDISIDWYYIFCAVYLSAVACAIHVIAITFLFRYMLVCKNRLLGMMDLWKLIAFPVVYAFGECGSMAFSFYQLSQTPDRAEICKRVLDHPMWWEGPVDNPTPPDKCIFSRIENPFFIVFVVAATVIHSSVYVIMGKCASDVLRALHKNRENFSDKTRQLHRQINIMLFTQMLAPIFTAFTPVVNLLIFPVFRLSLPGIGLFINVLFACIPLMNPLIALAFVGPFRRTIIRTLLRFVPCQIQCTVVKRQTRSVVGTSSVHSKSDAPPTLTNEVI